MKRYLVFCVLVFMIGAVALPVWSQGKAEPDPEQESEYYILKQDGREQVLGGKSDHAGNGLARAVERARFMQRRGESDDGKDDTGTVVHKKKKK